MHGRTRPTPLPFPKHQFADRDTGRDADRAVFEKLLDACRIAAFPENKKFNYELNMMHERDIIAQREYAVQNGFNNGRKEGREEGRAEGLEEGKKMTQIETAKNLLKAGVAPGVIAECVGLSLDFVKSL